MNKIHMKTEVEDILAKTTKEIQLSISTAGIGKLPSVWHNKTLLCGQ